MNQLTKTLFIVPKMDCPSEEKLIRMALADLKGVEHLKFDLAGRTFTAFHEGTIEQILSKLQPLNFGAIVSSSELISEVEENILFAEKANSVVDEKSEAKVLRTLLFINATMFIAEIILGYIAQSTGLIADAMDMFADAAVYGISLYAVGKARNLQRKAARISGYLQLLLALFALSEVARRFIFGSEPEAQYMMFVSFVALIANVICLVLISRHRSGGVHMKASAIFSANDVIANCGVILAGALVSWTGSAVPDLAIGLFIAAIVFRGALTILTISKEPEAE